MQYPICTDCNHGVVQQREQHEQLQGPQLLVYCTLLNCEMPFDLTFCSSQTSKTATKFHILDTLPEPQILRTKEGTRKRIKEVLLNALKTMR